MREKKVDKKKLLKSTKIKLENVAGNDYGC